jgi:hypothetical protein
MIETQKPDQRCRMLAQVFPAASLDGLNYPTRNFVSPLPFPLTEMTDHFNTKY